MLLKTSLMDQCLVVLINRSEIVGNFNYSPNDNIEFIVFHMIETWIFLITMQFLLSWDQIKL